MYAFTPKESNEMSASQGSYATSEIDAVHERSQTTLHGRRENVTYNESQLMSRADYHMSLGRNTAEGGMTCERVNQTGGRPNSGTHTGAACYASTSTSATSKSSAVDVINAEWEAMRSPSRYEEHSRMQEPSDAAEFSSSLMGSAGGEGIAQGCVINQARSMSMCGVGAGGSDSKADFYGAMKDDSEALEGCIGIGSAGGTSLCAHTN